MLHSLILPASPGPADRDGPRAAASPQVPHEAPAAGDHIGPAAAAFGAQPHGGTAARHWAGLLAVNFLSAVGYGLAAGDFDAAHWTAAAVVAAASLAVGTAFGASLRARRRAPAAVAASEMRALLLDARDKLGDDRGGPRQDLPRR